MEMARVGFDLRWWSGTTVHYVENLLRALAVQGREKFHFVCYGHGPGRQVVAELDGTAEFRQIPWSNYSVQGQVLLPRLLRRDCIQLFHSPFYMMPFLSRVPTIVTIHDTIPFFKYTDHRGLKRMTICAPDRLDDSLSTKLLYIGAVDRKFRGE